MSEKEKGPTEERGVPDLATEVEATPSKDDGGVSNSNRPITEADDTDLSEGNENQNISHHGDLPDTGREAEEESADHGDSHQISKSTDVQSSGQKDLSEIETKDLSLESRDLSLDSSIAIGNIDMENQSSDGRNVLEKNDQEKMEEQSSDDADFTILDRDPEDMRETVEQETLDSKDEEQSNEENEFSVVNQESTGASADDTDRDLSGLGRDSGDREPTNVLRLRPVDLFANGGNTRQRQVLYRRKARRIQEILSGDPVDVDELRQLSISQGGLLNADFRQKVWPLLLNVNVDNIAPKPDEEVLKNHKDYTQVVMDVNRSIKRFPPGMEENHRLSLQDKLVDVIMRVLVRHPELHYYQGFHDICVTFLLVVNEDMAFALVDKLSQSHLRDFMAPTMDDTQLLLEYVPCILHRANPKLLAYLEGAELGSVFCVSWLLTWFGHVLNDIASILRIYDFFIACHPYMPLYVLSAVILHRAGEIFATEQEMASQYQLLIVVSDTLPFEQLLSNAGDLYLQYPPATLADEALARYKRGQEKAAKHRAMVLARQKEAKRRASLLPDGNVTFTKITCWMLGAVVSVAAYALYTGMELDWNSWIPHG